MSQQLLFPRLRRALLNDALRIWKPVVIATVALLGLTTIIYINSFDPNDPDPTSIVVFGLYLIGGGLVLTSLAFQDMHHPLERYRYLMLPISNLERFLCRYLLTGPLFLLYLIIAFSLVDWIANAIATRWTGHAEPLFDAFSVIPGWIMYGYMILHAMMLLGAICFRSYALIKTALTGMLVFCGTVASLYLSLRIFYFGSFSWTDIDPVKDLDLSLQPMFAVSWMNTAAGALFALWVLYVGYRCLKAHEVQDEL